jgi:formate-dependent phosphoribosylglycinamide formyltransferase (GAR transformylase)
MLVAAGKNWSGLIETLAPYDEATAAQVAHLLHSMNELDSDMLREALKRGAPATVAGFQAYQAALRDAELARAP